MSKVLVIGASGFVGRRLVQSLIAEGHAVRGVARTPARVTDLVAGGCEIVAGDISDRASMLRAVESVEAVYISVHTLAAQHAGNASQGFMDVEMTGLQNIVDACRTHGVRRLIYITSLGIAPDAKSEWVTGRWKTEQYLLQCGLHATIIRPGQIVGIGGQGFGMSVANAKRKFALVLGKGRQKMRGIALDDLVYYLIGVMNLPTAFGKCFDVGCDDVLTNDQMIDVAADVLGRKHPVKVHIPLLLFKAMVPLLERSSKFQKGAIRGISDCLGVDLVGDDPTPIRALLPRPLLSYRQAVERALTPGKT